MNNASSTDVGQFDQPPRRSLAQFIADSRVKNRKRRHRGLPGLWSFAVLAWAALTAIQVMQAIASSVPLPVPEGGAPLPTFPVFEGVLMWVALSFGVLAVALVRKKAFRRLFFSLRELVPTLLALAMGAFLGTNIFTLMMLDFAAQSVSSAFVDFPQVQKKMVMFSYATPEQKATWFDDDGSLRPQTKQAWCANAMPRLETYSDVATSKGKEHTAINVLLMQGLYTKTYALGCLTDTQLMSRMHQLHAIAASGTRQQTIMESMGWFAPVLHIAAQANPLVVQRTMFTPKRACASLGRDPVDPVERMNLCNTFPADRAATKQDLPKIYDALASLPLATVNPLSAEVVKPSTQQAVLAGVGYEN